MYMGCMYMCVCVCVCVCVCTYGDIASMYNMNSTLLCCNYT